MGGMRMAAEERAGRLGEAGSGDRPNGSHINVVIARRGSPTAAAIVGALATPRPGHVPFMAVLEPGGPVRPITGVVNKGTIWPYPHGPLTRGAAQLGLSQGGLDARAARPLHAAGAGSI